MADASTAFPCPWHRCLPRRNLATAAILLAVLSGLIAGCRSRGEVVRMVDGQELTGHYVDERAYAAHLRGSLAEEDGDLVSAEVAYQEASESDPWGMAPRVRLAAVRCARARSPSPAAEQVFADALKIDDSYGPLYLERARCAFRHKNLGSAEADARRALVLDPKDVEVSLLLADIVERAGRIDEAAAIIDGLVVWQPGSLIGWQAMLDRAVRADDSLRVAVARRQLARLKGVVPGDEPTVAAGVLEQLDAALTNGDLAAARRLATTARIDQAAVAVRASALGRWREALLQARLVLAADPSNVDALVALVASPEPAMAEKVLGKATFERVLWLHTGSHGSRASPLAALVLGDALGRRMGEPVARLFFEAYGPVDVPPGDPLFDRLHRRVSRADPDQEANP